MMFDGPLGYDTYQNSIDHQSLVRQDGTSHGTFSDILDPDPQFPCLQSSSVLSNLPDHEASEHSKVYGQFKLKHQLTSNIRQLERVRRSRCDKYYGTF